MLPLFSIISPWVNLFINDLGLFLSETFLSNYADDNKLYSTGKELDILKEKRQKDLKVVTDLFFENYMSLNLTKCHYMCLGRNKEKNTFTWKIYLLKIVKKK